MAVSVIVLRGGLVEDHGVACFWRFCAKRGLDGRGVWDALRWDWNWIGLDWIGPPIEAFWYGIMVWIGIGTLARSKRYDILCYDE